MITMPPSVAVIQIDNPFARSHRFWIPLFLVWFVLLLFSPLLLLILLVACFALRVNPFKVLSVFWGIYCALKGTRIDVQDRANHIQVRVF